MKNLFFLSIILVSITVSCSDNKGEKNNKEAKQSEAEKPVKSDADQIIEEIDTLTSGKTFDKSVIDLILSKSVTFFQRFPDDERTPKVLFVAAVNAQAMGERTKSSNKPMMGYFVKTVEFCDLIINNYKNFEDLKLVYNLKATILDLDLEKDDEAILLYNYLIENYPEDTFNVENWSYRIEHISEDPLEMIMGS